MQNVGSRQGKKPPKSTPVKDARDGKERTTAHVEDLQNSYKHSLLKNGTEAPLQEFLLFLLAMALPHKIPESDLLKIWNSILSAAVDLCNEDRPVPVPAGQESKEKSTKAAESKASKSEPSGSNVTYCKNQLQALLHSYREAKGPESTRYALWVQLSNHILEKLRESRLADRLTELRLPKLVDVNGSTLIFQRNGNKQIESQHVGLEGLAIYNGTSRCPDVTALPIAAAERTTGQLSPESGSDWKTKWQDHSLNAAPNTPHIAPTWSDILLNVKFKKEKGYEMQCIPKCYDLKAEVVDVKPHLLRRSGTGDTGSDADETGSDADDTGSDADDICSYVDDVVFEEEDADVPSIAKSKNKNKSACNSNSKKRSRGRPGSSARGSGKKWKSNSGDAFSSVSKNHPPPPLSSKSKPPPSVQMAMYAAERLSSSVAVRHSIDILVIDDKLWLWWFDRVGTIQSHGLNFITNLPVFVALLAVLQRFTPENWGKDMTFGSGSHPNVKLFGPPEKLDGPRPEVEIKIAVDRTQLAINLFSRAPCVVPAECDTDFSEYGVTNSEYVAKIYFPDETRSNEAEILGEVYKIAAGENGGDVRGHVPILLAERTWRDTSADLIEAILGIARKGSKRRKRYRDLRILLFTKLRPITALNALDFIKALRSIVLCHGALWIAGVHHRDISENNLMFARVDDENSGVINDFDLAIVVREGDDRQPGEERTGTRIYMAHKLVENLGNEDGIPHIYEFDVESLAYVTLWITARYKDGSLRAQRPYSNWTTLDSIWLSDHRSFQLCAPGYMSPSYTQYKSVFVRFFKTVVDRVLEGKTQVPPPSPKSPEEILKETKDSIDAPLSELGIDILSQVKTSQINIRDKSPRVWYGALSRWGLVDWKECISLT